MFTTRIFIPIFILGALSTAVMAETPKEAMDFFIKYTNFANNYDENLLDMYSPDAKIIREVVKPSGELVEVVVPTKRYFKELKLGQKTAKLRKYRNKYRNIIAQEVPEGIKITAERQPSKETYWLKMYQIVKDTDSGLKITEEMMQTKVQAFLNQKDNN